MSMVTYMRANGKMIRLLARAYTNIIMEQNIKDNGTMIISMALESKLGLTAADTKETTMKERKMDKVSIPGRTVAIIKVSGKITK